MNVCVDILGPEKSVKQFLKAKLTFLKDGYKQAKDNKPRTSPQQFCPYYDDFDDMMGDHDMISIKKYCTKNEVFH